MCVNFYSRYRQSCGSSTLLYILGLHHTSSCYTHENHIRLQIIIHNFLLNIVYVTVQFVEVKISDSSIDYKMTTQ